MTDELPQDPIPGTVRVVYLDGTVANFNLPNRASLYLNPDDPKLLRFVAYPEGQEAGPLMHHYLNFGALRRFETSW